MKISAVPVLAVAVSISCGQPPDADVRRDAPAEPFIEHVLNSGLTWHAVTTEHFVVRAIAGSFAHDDLTAQAAAVERARRFVLRQMAEADSAADTRAHVFLVRGRDDISRLVGQPAGGWTEPQANAILAAASDSVPPPLRHELGHLYSHRLWGVPHAAWLSEGVAVFAVGHCAGLPLHQWAAAILRTGEDASLDSLQRSFDFGNAAPHLLAGSFVAFVADRHGIEAVKTLWRHGLAAAQEATGSSYRVLEGAWHEELRRTPMPQDMPDFRGRVRCEDRVP